MNTQHLKPSEIKTAKYNPRKREDLIGPLIKSIKEFGIIVPLIVDAEHNLIDGHRRLASAKKLKMEKVPCLQVDSKLSKDKAYEIINTHSKKITNKDFIFIHVNGGSVPNRALNQINLIEEIVGADKLKKLGEIGTSYRILDYAYRIRKYCHDDSESFLKKVVLWLAFHNMSFAVRRAMDTRVKKEVIARAIAVNRPLKIKYE